MLGIYTRLSSDDDKGNSIENQLREGKEFAKLNGFGDSFEIYNEGEGVSGRKDLEERPVLFQLVKDIKVKKITAVWFRHQNRLDRNSLTFQLFAKEVKKVNARVFFSNKEEDFNDPNSMFQIGMMSLVSTYQAELTGVQVKKVNKDNVSEGKVVGKIPFGFRKGENKMLEVCPENSKIVEEIFQDYLNGMGTTLIAQKLNDMGIPTLSKKSHRWKDSTVLYILKNELYIGKRKYSGQTYEVEPIIKKSIFNKVQAKIENSGTKKGKKTGHKYLLNELLVCGCCGEPFLGRSQSHRGYYYYICKNHRYKDKSCSNRSVKMEHLDELVWDSLFRDASLFKELKKLYKQGDREVLKKELSKKVKEEEGRLLKLEGRKQRVQRMVEEEIMKFAKAKIRIKELDLEESEIIGIIEKLKEQHNSISNERKLIEDLRKDFPWLIGDEQREEWEKAGLLLDADVVNEERIRAFVGFNEKQKMIQKYVESIKIAYLEEDNEFNVEVSFKIPIKNKNLRLQHNLGRKPRKLSSKE